MENKIKRIEVKEGKSMKVRFDVKDIEEIVTLESTCGCSTPRKDYKNSQIVVIFRAGKIPIHLKGEGMYSSSSQVIVTRKSGEKEIFRIKAKITK